MKLKVTQQQRDNALEALHVMWPSVPPENVFPDLADWRDGGLTLKAPHCGTAACFGGWCAWWPSFRAQGVHPTYYGAPDMNESGMLCSEVSQALFGHVGMFAGRGGFPGEWQTKWTDHEIVTRRLQWLIENSEVVG